MGVQQETIEVIDRMARTVSKQVTAAVSANVSKQVADLKTYVVEELSKDRERISSLEIVQDIHKSKIEKIESTCAATHPRKTSNSVTPKPEKAVPSSFAARIKVWVPAGVGIGIGLGFGIKFLIESGVI